MSRKIGGLIVVIVGAMFVAVVFSERLVTVGPAFERMTDEFRPVMNTQNLEALRTDVNGFATGAQEFKTKILAPAAQAAGVTVEQLTAQLTAGYPAAMKGLTQAPAIATGFGGAVDLLKAEQVRFAEADAIPTSNLPATTIPWSLFAAGVALIGLGLLIVRPGKKALALTLAVGLALVVVPLASSLPGKASSADTMNAHLRPVYTQQFVDGAQASLTTVSGMAQEMNARMIPAFARQAGKTVAEFQQGLAVSAPALARAIQGMPAAIDRFTKTVAAFRGSLADYGSIKSVSLAPIVWTIVGGGALTILIAGTLLLQRPTTHAEVYQVHTRRAA
jgi:hypothetical protein